MEFSFNYQYDIPRLIKKQLIIPYKNYRKKLSNIYYLINNYRNDYYNKDYGTLLYNIKTENIHTQKWKYQYLSSIEIFYKNNNHHFPELFIVDMHGLYVQDMIEIMNVLYHNWIERNIKQISIITGNGNRILFKELIKYLQKWNIKYQEYTSNVKIYLV